jgi:hypothetical protein
MLKVNFRNANNYAIANGHIAYNLYSRISNSYSLRQGRRQPTTTLVEELEFLIVIAMYRRKIEPPHWGGKPFKNVLIN